MDLWANTTPTCQRKNKALKILISISAWFIFWLSFVMLLMVYFVSTFLASTGTSSSIQWFSGLFVIQDIAMLIGFAYAHFYDMTHWKGSIFLKVWVDNLNSSFRSRVKGYSLFHSPASIRNAEQSLERDRVRFVEYLTRSSWRTPSIYSWHVISWRWLLAIYIGAVLSLHIAIMEDTMHWFPKYCSWVAAGSHIVLMFFIDKWTHWYLAMGGIARKMEELCNNRDLEKSGEAWPELEWWKEALLGDAQNDLITDEKTMSTEKSGPHLTVTSTC